jgi:hypothetical protein
MTADERNQLVEALIVKYYRYRRSQNYNAIGFFIDVLNKLDLV